MPTSLKVGMGLNELISYMSDTVVLMLAIIFTVLNLGKWN